MHCGMGCATSATSRARTLLSNFDGPRESISGSPRWRQKLVRLKPDVIITHGTPGTLAAKRATTTIPIVMAVVGDAVVTGVVSSLARPGGNITGSTFFNPELGAKRLELLKETFPLGRRFGALVNPDNPMAQLIVQGMETPAESLKIELHTFEARRPAEFPSAFQATAERRVEAVTVIEDPMFIANAGIIGEIASTRRLPLIGFREIVEAGGLVAYGVRWHEMYRRAAVFANKSLKGDKPGDLPIEQATRFELVINLKTAKALGLTVPPIGARPRRRGDRITSRLLRCMSRAIGSAPRRRGSLVEEDSTQRVVD